MDKREDILKAALSLFAARGSHGTAVPLIADRAKVGAGTIYRYFKDKENLVNELYRFWKNQLFEAIIKGLSEDMPLRTRFHEIWIHWIAFSINHPEAALFIKAHHHAPCLDDISVALNEKIMAAFLQLVEPGCRGPDCQWHPFFPSRAL
jgi:AcrR family transcriptional regulator